MCQMTLFVFLSLGLTDENDFPWHIVISSLSHGHVFSLKTKNLFILYLLRIFVPADNKFWNFQTKDSFDVFLKIW